MPNRYDEWLDQMLGPVGGEQTFQMEPWTPPAAPPRRPRRQRPVEPPATPELSDWQRYGAMGARGIGGLFGFTPVTGALGGALGEIVAQGIEEEGIPELSWENAAHVGGEAAAGAVGGGFAKLLGSLAGAPVKAALSGALLGGAAPILRHGISEGEWDPREYAKEVGISAGLSGLTGGTVAHFTGAAPILGKKAVTGPEPFQVEPTQIPGGRSFQGGNPGMNTGVRPIPPSGQPVPTLAPPTRVPTNLDTGGPTPYVGMPSTTQKQQRMIEAEQKAAEKAATEAAKLKQIEDQMAEAGVVPQPPTFGTSLSAKTPDGASLRMSQRFGVPEEGAADNVAEALAANHPYYVPKEPVRDAQSIQDEIAAIQAQMASEAATGVRDRTGLKEMLGAYPPARSQAVGVPDAPPSPMVDIEFGGAIPNLRRQGLQRMLGEYPPAPSQAVGVGPEPPLGGPFTPDLPPSPAGPEPQAPSGLAKVLGVGKRGKRAPKSKVAKFDDAVSKILGQTDEAAQVGPGGFEVPSAAGPIQQVSDDLIPTPPGPYTPPPTDFKQLLTNELAEEMASPIPNLQDISDIKDDLRFVTREGLKSTLRAYPPARSQAVGVPKAPIDIAGDEYKGLQQLFKAGKAPKEVARAAGKALRQEAQAAGLPIGKAATAAAKPASTLEEMLNASVAARTAPEAAQAGATVAPEAAQASNWVADLDSEITRLSQLPPEQRLQALLDGPLTTQAPDIPLAATSSADATPDWVAKAMAEVDEASAASQKLPSLEEIVGPEEAAKVGMAVDRGPLPSIDDVNQLGELQKLLMRSGAIKEPGEIGNWLSRLRQGESVIPEGPPPPVAPAAPKAGRGRLRTSGTREDAPLPQDYSPTPAGKAVRAGKAPATVGPVTSKDAPFAVVVGSGKTQVSKGFATQEEATAFLNAARETGKFKDIRLVSAADEAKTNLTPRLKKGKKGEAGFGQVQLMSSLLGGGLGAAAGAANSDEDPLTGALLGAAGGAALGASIPAIASGLTNIGANPKTVSEAVQRLQHDGDTHKAAAKIAKTLPQILRFNYLMDIVGLPANAGFGPWGSGVFGTLEKALAGDPRGWPAFREIIDPRNFLRELPSSFDEAQSLVGRAEGYALSEASTAAEKTLSWPGTVLTSGDVAIRRILQRHGFSDDEARIMTLTGEPFTRTGESGAHLRGLGWDLTFPFKRTPINVLEQGMLRTPGLGFLVQGAGAARGTRAADPLAQQLIQQGLGAGVFLGADQLGNSMDPDSARIARRYVSNVGGPYSLLASLGFTVGQARNRGIEGARPLANEVVRTLPYNLPMPSVEPITDAARFMLNPEAKVPRGAYPRAYDQLVEWFTPEPDLFEGLRRTRR